MRVLLKQHVIEAVMIEIIAVKYDIFVGKGRIFLETAKGPIIVTVSQSELKDIKCEFLRNGYYDFQAYKTDWSRYDR